MMHGPTHIKISVCVCVCAYAIVYTMNGIIQTYLDCVIKNINPFKGRVIILCTTRFNIQKFYVLPTE